MYTTLHTKAIRWDNGITTYIHRKRKKRDYIITDWFSPYLYQYEHWLILTTKFILMKLKWLIYCRVSSVKQVKEWNGLSSQEKRCRDYATATLWIEVEGVFNEEGVSGGVFERKSIQDLLKYIDKNKSSDYIVIFEDLNRLSRDIQVHGLLKAEFKKRGVELASPNFQFEESPEWAFRENMSVSMAQYEKDKNKQRVNDRMRARLEQWYWCFVLPIGLKYSTNSKGGKEILFDESNYKVVKSTLEKYASDELKTINDVARHLNKKWIKVWTIRNGKVHNSNLVSRMLKNILYAWYIEFPKWWIKRLKAQHKAIISLKTFENIQKKLKKNPQYIESKIESNLNRVDRSNDFPLRGFLYCEKSKQMISGSWSQWKKEKFPYYTYPRKSSMFGKVINRDKLHIEFSNLLISIQPNESVVQAFEKVVIHEDQIRKDNDMEYRDVLESDMKKINSKINKFIERIWSANSEVLIENYEKQVEELEREKVKISQNLSKEPKDVRTPLKRKMKMVRNALDIWKYSDVENKKSLLKSIFPEGIPINEKKQVGTPTFSLVYQSFSIGESSHLSMVDFVKRNLNTLLD